MPTAAQDIISPHNLEAERALLGSILLDNACLANVRAAIDVKDFYSEANRIIFSAIIGMAEAGHQIDTVTLSDELRQRGQMEKAGGPVYLERLVEGVPIGTQSGIQEYCRITKEAATRRRLMHFGNELMARAGNRFGETAQDLAAYATFTLQNIVGDKSQDAPIITPVQLAEDQCPKATEDCFYGPAKIYRDLLGELTEPSDNFHLACFISIMAAAIGRAVAMNMPKVTHANQYIVLVGESAWARKGTAMAFAEDLLVAAPMVTLLTSVDSGEGTARAIRDAIQQQDARRRYGVLCIVDEFNSILSKAAQKGSKIIPDLKRNYDWHSTLQINSSINRVQIEDPPTLNVLAASEIEDLTDMTERDLRGGLGNRLMYVPGEGKPPNPDSAPPFRSDWYPLIDLLRGILDFWRERNQNGTTMLHWTPEAHARWRVFYKAAKKRGEDDPRVNKLAARHCVHVPKVAMLWAAMDKETEFVRLKHLEAAIAWCDFCLKGLYHIFRTVGLKPWVRESMEIVAYIKRQGGAVEKRKLRRRFDNLGGEDFERRMKYLVADQANPERELIEQDRFGKGGRKVKWIVLNER